MKTASAVAQLEEHEGGLARVCVSLVFGLLATAVIFYGLVCIQRVKTSKTDSGIEDLTSVSLPFDLPPPAQRLNELKAAPVGSPVQFEIASTASSVKIEVSPMPILPPQATLPLARPGIVARFQLGAGVVKPEVAMDPDRIYNKAEVDQPPVVVYRKVPDVAAAIFKRVAVPRVVLLFVVSSEGKVLDPHLLKSCGDTELDQLMVEMIADWEFRPAVKKGKIVRCWVQQTVRLTLGSASRFSAD